MLSPPSMTPPPNPQVNALICWTLSMKITMLGYIVIEDCIVWMRNKKRQLTSGGQRQKAKLSVGGGVVGGVTIYIYIANISPTNLGEIAVDTIDL